VRETTEFSFPQAYATDRRSPVRWIASHAVHQWPFLVGGVLGAVGNAAMGTIVPITVGKAVNAVRDGTADAHLLLGFALLVAGSQTARMAFHFLRGASF